VLFAHDPETENLLTPVLQMLVGIGVTIEVGLGADVGGVSGGVRGAAAFWLRITR
jgi:hypothetical protein